MLKDLKLSKKLFLGLGIIVAVSTAMMLTAIVNLYSVGGLINKLYQSPFTVSTQSIMVQKELQDMGREIRGMVLYEDSSYYDSALTCINKARESLALVETRFLGNQQLIQDMYQNLDELEVKGKEIKQLVVDEKMDEAKTSADINFRPTMKSGIKISQEIVDFALNKALEFNEDASVTLNNATTLLCVLLVFLIVLCVGISIILSRTITRPITQITEAAEKLAEGTLSIGIAYQSKDEVGILADSFRKMSGSLKAVILDVDHQLGAMSIGDFTTSPLAEYTGDYASIKSALINIRKSLSNTLNEINQSADQVYSGASQVSNSAVILSQGATEQAASVEELASAINEISFQVKGTAANTEDARHRTTKAGELVSVSNRQMEEMLLAIGEISSKTEEIRAINNVIEEIAFQTKILALNAAVEAARAGEFGNGFGVVADEVRRLADKSSEAAQNTLVLIDDTIQAVKKGTEIANTTAKSLRNVVDSTYEVLATVDKIDAAAQNQANSIVQVTQGINQISGVVQNNSASSEESAAASEELSALAQALKGLVSQFKFAGTDDVNSNHPTAEPD